MAGLDMWWKDDIANVLVGIDLARAQMATDRNDDERRAYQDGFQAALTAVAASLGVYLIAPTSRVRVRAANGDMAKL